MLKFIARDYRVLRDVSVVLDKVVLYGPNGAGKSTTLYALLLTLSSLNRSLQSLRVAKAQLSSLPIDLADNGMLMLENDGRRLVLRKGGNNRAIEVIEDPGKQYTVILYLPSGLLLTEAEVQKVKKVFEGTLWGDEISVAYVDGCNVEIVRVDTYEHYDVCTSEPEESSRFMEVVHKLVPPTRIDEFEGLLYQVLGIERIYGDSVRIVSEEGSEWLKFSDLSYGQRRVLAILLGAFVTNTLIVEAFEAGLHVDLAIDLINALSHTKNFVFIETHLGVVLRHALLYQWKVYRFDKGTSREITLNDLSNVDLFNREYQAYLASV